MLSENLKTAANIDIVVIQHENGCFVPLDTLQVHIDELCQF